MDYRTSKFIVTWKKRDNMRLRVMDTRHVGRHGEQRYLVQKETADHPMHGLFSVLPAEVDYNE